MRTILVIVSTLLQFSFFLSTCYGDGFKLELYRHETNAAELNHITNVWSVSTESLDKVPSWAMGDGEPPLPLGKAIELARAWIVSKGCQTNSWVREVVVRPVYPDGGKYKHICYYNILFGGVGLYGHFRRCIILMDGTIVEPELVGGVPKHFSYYFYDE
jgi:hypothetical protein